MKEKQKENDGHKQAKLILRIINQMKNMEKVNEEFAAFE